MIETVEGIIISEKDYSETSKILELLTIEYGLIGIISKGCKRIKSDLRNVSTIFSYGKFNINYKEGKLSNLISVDIINPFKNIKKDIEKISYATYILELTSNVIKQSDNKEIYNILIDSLIKIDEGFDSNIIKNIVEIKYLNYFGVTPILDCCSVCGSKTSIATLSTYKGGLVCNNCLTNEKIVSEKTIKLVRALLYVDIKKISKLEIDSKIKKELNEFIDDYYDNYTGLYLKSKRFLKELNTMFN